jgi:hypothetical protein
MQSCVGKKLDTLAKHGVSSTKYGELEIKLKRILAPVGDVDQARQILHQNRATLRLDDALGRPVRHPADRAQRCPGHLRELLTREVDALAAIRTSCMKRSESDAA